MHAVELFCMNNSIPCIYCDFRFKGYAHEQIKGLCKNADVVLLDNADLYLTSEIPKQFKNTDKLLIICMKDTSKIDMKDIYEYIVNYDNLSITIEEY